MRVAMGSRAPSEGEAAKLENAQGQNGEVRSIDPVERPQVPLLLVFALEMWVVLAISTMAFYRLSTRACLLFAVVCLAASAVALAIFLARRLCASAMFVCLLACLVSLVLGGGHAALLHAHMDALCEGVSGRFDFVIVEDPREGDFGTSAVGRTMVDGLGLVDVRLNLPEGTKAGCWSHIQAYCTIKSAYSDTNDSAWRKGCAGKASLKAAEVPAPASLFGILGSFRQAALERFLQIDSDGAVLAESVSLGSRTRLFASDLYGSVKMAGLAHVVAVSGAHFSIVASFILLVARALHMGRRPAAILQMSLLGGFLVVSGAPHSALRAALMAACTIGAFFAHRRGWAANALGACIVALLLARPSLALSASFALSACATLSILLFARYFSWWFGVLARGRCQALCDLLGMSVAAVAGTAPLACGMFGQISLLGPLSSVLAMPACAVLCVGGLVASILCALAPPWGEIAVGLVSQFADGCCAFVHVAAKIPFVCIGVPADSAVLLVASVALGVLLYWFWPQPTLPRAAFVLSCMLASLAFALVVAPLLHKDEVVMLDVGQGDAIAIRSGAQTVLFDTGNQDAMVVKALARHDIREIDLLVVTHPDDDHCGSIEAICQTVPVRRIAVARDLLSCSCGNCSGLRARIGGMEVLALEAGDRVGWGAFEAHVLSPSSFREEGGNQDSIVMGVYADCDRDGSFDWSVLMTGDAEAQAIGKLVEEGFIGRIDILKVGHHGSRASLDEGLVRDLSPKIALVSAGRHNRYGHPAPETLSLLQDVGSVVLRTDLQGDVSCNLTSESVEIDEHG